MEFVKKYLRLKKISMEVAVCLCSRSSRTSFIMLPLSIVAILLPPHLSQNGPK